MSEDDDSRDDPSGDVLADVLISRIIDHEAADSDWSSFERLAERHPTVWPRLLAGLRDDAALRAAMERRLGLADRVELPSLAARRAIAGWRGWTGWAAAVLLAVLWWGASWATDIAPIGLPPLEPGSGEAARVAGGLPVDARRTRDTSTAELISELPLQVLETRRAADGQGLEVLYVRPLLERTRVDGVYELGVDEFGRPMPRAIDPAVLLASQSL
jgi:hypothetical protein